MVSMWREMKLSPAMSLSALMVLGLYFVFRQSCK